jgi:hypothetical protein
MGRLARVRFCVQIAVRFRAIFAYKEFMVFDYPSDTNGMVSDKPRRLPRHQRAQAHNSTLYRCQHSFVYWLCSKQNCLLCAYECVFRDNDMITNV